MRKCGLFSASLLLAMGVAHGQTVDLVGHNGFEACWSQALTEAQFLAELQAANNGQTTCLPAVTTTISGLGSMTTCYLAQCPGNTIGCPVTQTTGPFSGDFTRTTGSFTASGNADGLIVPVQITVPPFGTSTCTIGAYSIALTYDVDFDETPDGNDGDYMAYQTNLRFTVNDTPGSTDCSGTFASTALAAMDTEIASDLTAAMHANLLQQGVGQSVCPLSP